MKRVASPRLAPVAIARGAGGTSRFPQAPSTGPLRGQAAPQPGHRRVSSDFVRQKETPEMAATTKKMMIANALARA